MATNFEQIRILRLLKKTAAVYLLLLCQDRPLRVIDVARLLEIDRETARNHLYSLATIGLVTRPSLMDGFILTGLGLQLVLGEQRASPDMGVEEFPPPIVVNVVKDSNIEDISLTSTTKKEAEEIPPVYNPAVWEALAAAGIIPNSRIERLVRRDYLTPDFVTAHFLRLKAQGLAARTGLLVTILESGAPAPPLNTNRHLLDCDCPECQALKYRACPYCGEYPCQCDEAEV